MSDHEPVYCVIECDAITEKSEDVEHNAAPKPKWKDANEHQRLEFNDIMFRKLSAMHIPDEVMDCRDIHCDKKEHRTRIDSYISDILESVVESGFETLPVIENKPKKEKAKKKVTAGWKEFVEPFQDKAKFWHAIWMSAGRPLNTELHNYNEKN